MVIKKTGKENSKKHKAITTLKKIDIFFHKRRTFDEIPNALGIDRIYGYIKGTLGGIWRFFRKKRSFKDIGESITDFLKETPEEEKKIPRNWLEKNSAIIWDSIMLILVYIFLFSGLKMEWFLKEIIPIGGDVPYHVANYFDFKEILLPSFQISGWSDASFAGFQLFQSYPIFPFVLIYFLDLFIGSGVAFKAILILGAVGLPLATYWTLLQSRVARPGPIFGAILSLAYLFHDDHFAFGGNLRSVFSGEFAHSLSILLLVIFCGFLYKAFENKKYIPHAIITLALIGFSHPISFAIAIFLPLGFLINRKNDTEEKTSLDTLKYSGKISIALRIMLVSGLLFCTWAIGYYVNQSFMGIGGTQIVGDSYGWGLTFHYLIPKLLLPFAVFFLIYIIYSIFQWKKISTLQGFFLWGFLISIGFFLFRFMGFAIRFLPLIYLFVMFFLATTAGKIYENTRREVVRVLVCCLVIASAAFIFYFVESNNIFQRYRGTSGHNFIGAESRGEWKSVQLTSEFLSKNFDTQTENKNTSHPPRVFSYFKGDLFRVTSRASIYDSLFSHSSFTSRGIWTGRQIDKQKISAKQFWDYMELSNTKIIIAPKELADYLEKTPYFSLIKTFDLYKIFETKNTSKSYVIPLKKKVYAINNGADWRKINDKWYGEYSEKSPFIVYNPDSNQTIFEKYDPKIPPAYYQDDCKVQEFVQREIIKISTNCIGRPLLVKFAYHQNWKVTGANGVYLTTPAFMIVVPTQNEVTLYYGKRPYNYLAYTCGILGIMLLFFYGWLEKKIIFYTKKFVKNHERLLHLILLVLTKLKILTVGNYFWQRSIPILLVFCLLISIAFIYTNRG